MEFVQFHPTCLNHPDAGNFLISEAVRGEGGVLEDARGTAFMHLYDSQKDLACRDVVARAIDTELKNSGDESVYLNISHKDPEFLKKRFPTIHDTCRRFGIDITRDSIPVVPAAHYMCGGILTDKSGRSGIKGLFAIGETACTGLHGANRLASNSLLEALVFAHNAAETSLAEASGQAFAEAWKTRPVQEDMPEPPREEVLGGIAEIRRVLWDYVGVVRSDKRLAVALEKIDRVRERAEELFKSRKLTRELIEFANMATVAWLIVRCAMERKESRGLHYSIDYPEKDEERGLFDSVIRGPLC
jgi:L-aspartate oxidase